MTFEIERRNQCRRIVWYSALLFVGAGMTSFAQPTVGTVSGQELLVLLHADMRESDAPDLLPDARKTLERTRAENFVATLPMPTPSSSASAGTVSRAKLMHKVPKKAKYAAGDARKLSQAGKHEIAIVELQKALVIDPDFAEARGNLGVEYLRLGRYAEAEDQIEKSLALDPTSAVMCTNLAFLELTRGDTKAAEASARRALRISSTYAQAHYFLGLSLQGLAEARDEAIRHLRYAARTVPAARRALDVLDPLPQ